MAADPAETEARRETRELAAAQIAGRQCRSGRRAGPARIDQRADRAFDGRDCQRQAGRISAGRKEGRCLPCPNAKGLRAQCGQIQTRAPQGRPAPRLPQAAARDAGRRRARRQSLDARDQIRRLSHAGGGQGRYRLRVHPQRQGLDRQVRPAGRGDCRARPALLPDRRRSRRLRQQGQSRFLHPATGAQARARLAGQGGQARPACLRPARTRWRGSDRPAQYRTQGTARSAARFRRSADPCRRTRAGRGRTPLSRDVRCGAGRHHLQDRRWQICRAPQQGLGEGQMHPAAGIRDHRVEEVEREGAPVRFAAGRAA